MNTYKNVSTGAVITVPDFIKIKSDEWQLVKGKRK